MSQVNRFARLAVVLAVCLLLPACVKSKLTQANFDKINNGMSLDEVEKILGKGEKEAESSGVGTAGGGVVAITSAPTVGGGDVYKWESSKATITITFRQGKVVHKAATGL